MTGKKTLLQKKGKNNCERTYAEVPTEALSSVIICTTFSVRSRGNLIKDRPGTYLNKVCI